jgi:hypothetical protein
VTSYLLFNGMMLPALVAASGDRACGLVVLALVRSMRVPKQSEREVGIVLRELAPEIDQPAPTRPRRRGRP